MAKDSSIENNKQRRRTGRPLCREAQGAESDHHGSLEADGRAFEGTAQAGRVAAEFFQDPDPQPVRNHRTSAGLYRKLQVCRNQLRELASQGQIPGMVKSSW